MNTELKKHVKTPEEAEAEEDVSLLVQLASNVTTKAPEKKQEPSAKVPEKKPEPPK